MVDRLLSKTTDASLLISRFQEFLELEDVRYYVMSAVRENVGKVMDKSKGVGELCVFNQQVATFKVFVLNVLNAVGFPFFRPCCPFTRATHSL